MADENVWVNASMDVETRSRLERIATQEDRSLSWIVRSLINQEYERRFSTVSVETPVDMAKPVAEPE